MTIIRIDNYSHCLGAAGVLIGHPLDTVKVKLQTQVSKRQRHQEQVTRVASHTESDREGGRHLSRDDALLAGNVPKGTGNPFLRHSFRSRNLHPNLAAKGYSRLVMQIGGLGNEVHYCDERFRVPR